MTDNKTPIPFLKWRAFGMIMCLVLWALLMCIRMFLFVMLPPVLMYPIMGMIALVLSSKFLAHISYQDEKHTLIIPVICFMTFIIMLTGSMLWVGVAAALALSGATQYLVRLGYDNRQYNTQVAYGLFAFVFLAIVASVFCYVTSGSILPTYLAMLVVNIFSVCFYFLNHPNIFEHYNEIPSFAVISMDFFALSILLHTCYIPVCLFFPSMFAISLSTGINYMFHAISLTLLTVFVMRPARKDEEDVAENTPLSSAKGQGSLSHNPEKIPQAQAIPSAPVMVSAVPEFSMFEAMKPVVHALFPRDNHAPSAPPKPV